MRKLKRDISTTALVPERVLQFGEGNFLRAFIDWMIHRMNETDVFNGSVVVVQPLEEGLVDLLNEQDGLYTLYLRGIKDGQAIADHELISSVSRGINPYSFWSDYLATARNPDMRFVVSNTTEAGIVYLSTERPADLCPASFPAKLTAWLDERYKVFDGSAESGMIIMPCELINHNGTRLKECILKHADDWGLGDGFISWINHSCVFLNTLVDRIVPGYPRNEVESMMAELGYEDRLICAGEIFHLLVIEGAELLKTELPFHAAGLNVVWCDDMQPYRTRKVGILNGAHTSSVLAAYLGGVDTVRDMMEDADFGRYVRSVLFDEIVPVLPMKRTDSEAFATAVMERFLNPYIRHELLSISLNSVSKWKVRVLPSLKSYMMQFGEVPKLLSFSLASLIAFYKGDLREGYAVNDDPSVVRFFAELWQIADPGEVVKSALANETLWGEDLTELAGLLPAVARQLNQVLQNGVRSVINDLLTAES